MPQRRHRFGKSFIRLVFLAAALSLLGAVLRRERSELLETGTRARRPKIRLAPKRIAVSLAFATLFFAGAALSAGAGNTVADLINPPSADQSAVGADPTSTTTTTDDQTPPTESTSTESAPAEPQPAAQPAAEPPPADQQAPADQQPAAEQAPAASQAASAPASLTHNAGVQTQLRQRARLRLVAKNAKSARKGGAKLHVNRAGGFQAAPPLIKAQSRKLRATVDREPEADEPGVAATVWLHRALPDPTPPSRRLKPAFARRLVRVAAKNHVDWALVLAVLRASGERGSVPGSPARLQDLSKHLSSSLAMHRSARDKEHAAWTSVLALEGRTTFADRTIALQRLYRAVGLKALVKGFDWAKPSLSKRILNDKRISIYPGGRADIEAGRVNIRVLALIAYLAEAHGQVTVSCLITGHRLYARPGVISAHIYGLAADISALGGVSIFGQQQPGSVTEEAVRNILLLPVEMQPRQVISLLGLGGPSFPLANHDDHIHVGF